MSDFYFDSYAVIEILRGNPLYEFVKDAIIITSTMNLAEIYYSLLLENGKEKADLILDKLSFEFLGISSEAATAASAFRFKNKRAKLSYIDCIGYVLAKENKLPFLTGDKEFEKFDNVKFVK